MPIHEVRITIPATTAAVIWSWSSILFEFLYIILLFYFKKILHTNLKHYTKMEPIAREPISRKQLNDAKALAMAEKEKYAYKQQELKGKFAADKLYLEIKRTAEVGERTRAVSESMELGVAFDTLLSLTKKYFPDCDVSCEIRHVSNNPTYAVRVEWLGLGTTSTEMLNEERELLESRRLEKETSW
jgi:hypothetical protein